MQACFFVGLGGFAGAVGRYLLSGISWQGEFPLITLLINFIGAVVIGFVSAYSEKMMMSSQTLLFLKTGVCGGFTTFSTFSLETYHLMEKGQGLTAGFYIGTSVFLCLTGVLVGRAVAGRMVS